jgi:hypothetical protein
MLSSHKDTLTFLLQHRTFQFFDLNSIILAGVSMPHSHFQSIRSVFLNAKYIAPQTSFTQSIAHFPRAYRQRFEHLSPASAPGSPQTCMRKPLTIFAQKGSFIDRKGATAPDAWYTVCHIFGQMRALHVLKMQLCHSAFSEVLFQGLPERIVSNEGWVFEPLAEIAKIKGKGLGLFEVVCNALYETLMRHPLTFRVRSKGGRLARQR